MPWYFGLSLRGLGDELKRTVWPENLAMDRPPEALMIKVPTFISLEHKSSKSKSLNPKP